VTPKQKLDLAVRRLIMSSPVFGPPLARLRAEDNIIVVSDDGDASPDNPRTAYTDGVKVVFYEKFLAKLPVDEIEGVLAHELVHYGFGHAEQMRFYSGAGFEGEPFNLVVANLAMDVFVNEALIEDGFKLPEAGATKSMFDRPPFYSYPEYKAGQLWQKTYKWMMGRLAKYSEYSGDVGKTVTGKIGADVRPAKASSGDKKSLLNEMAAAAAMGAKGAGKATGALLRALMEVLAPPVDWREELAEFLIRTRGDECSDWSRIDRRAYAMLGVIAPRRKGEQLGEIVFAIDTSGSMSNLELSKGAAAVMDLIASCSPAAVTVLGCDAQVDTIIPAEKAAELGDELGAYLRANTKGGGGTLFAPALDWARDNIDPNDLVAVIYYTDMMPADWPDEKNYDFPVIWAATTDIDPPWGRAIRINLEENKL
jgi:predicted metal-dependent peptidase